jgi:5-methyltetrahydropteroyltriglutamate--homocysteine methyltransferase
MKLSTERVLTTHTGSLPRPRSLAAALQQQDRGQQASDALAVMVREAVTDVVNRQIDAGILVVNDGEASKMGYST